MSTTQRETANPWRPNMVYNPRRSPQDAPGLLGDFIEKSATTLYRAYIPDTPNKDFGPMMAKATYYVFTIDLFVVDETTRNGFFARLHSRTTPSSAIATIFEDHGLVNLLCVLGGVRNAVLDPVAASRAERLILYHRHPNMLDQLVWAIVHPDDGHPGVQQDVDDRFFVAVLLVHHFKHHGGLVLPNLEAARSKEAAHQILVDSYKVRGNSSTDLMMHYPNWRDSLTVHRPPGLGGSLAALTVVPTLLLSPSSGPTSPDKTGSLGTIGDSRRQF
ncbi:uncharacterized protein EKO05_0002533 [Ascochyta rabiei]|uniref:Uncharacterized protein n=1 Tax=Didymella rabiei TaxID=5454 RepID=A0A163IKL1_DIDRA|nr:uncharacterized protein EKO05_0002533 [Ascochyta rabiei]KZM25787.1 hypothetical protein ST47_g3098 [Ascochyta rabiei]UPX11951.1 hypothetical protein EKO05_0002533 [Ascochyta rabiei]